MRRQALLDIAREGGFWSYMAGVAWQIQSNHEVGGLVIENDRTDLPIKKGLSSSAAACVLTARAFSGVYDLGFSVRDEMEVAYRGERLTPSRCGRMDQGCAFGAGPVLMAFDGEALEATEVHAGADLHLVLVDLGGRKDTVRILSRLNRAFQGPDLAASRGVRDLLGPINREIVERAVEILGMGDGERLGALMTEAQGLFDRYAAPMCPEELAAPRLHRVLAHTPLGPHVWGGKGMGSQGDGTAQLLARSARDQAAAIELLERDLGVSCLKLTLGPSGSHTAGP